MDHGCFCQPEKSCILLSGSWEQALLQYLAKLSLNNEAHPLPVPVVTGRYLVSKGGTVQMSSSWHGKAGEPPALSSLCPKERQAQESMQCLLQSQEIQMTRDRRVQDLRLRTWCKQTPHGLRTSHTLASSPLPLELCTLEENQASEVCPNEVIHRAELGLAYTFISLCF